MDTFADGHSPQPERPAGEPRRRRRWPFVVGGLMALGLIGLAIVAVVLILTASDEMHQSILDFSKNTGKPVVVSMGDTAASGGYYIATAADRIVANETTLTGSLGVIIPLNNFAEAANKYGIKQVVIKSGKYKDMGSAF